MNGESKQVIFNDNRGTEFAPGRLWSLLDMLKQTASAFVLLGERINEAEIVFYTSEIEEGRARLTSEEEGELRTLLGAMRGLCQRVGLPVSDELLKGRREHLPSSSGEFRVLVDAMKAELRGQLFLFVPSDRASFYDDEDALSEEARKAFPNAAQEVREAGNCYATGNFTACVFHAMRALEYGIGALSSDVGITFDIQNWQNVLDEIEAAIKQEGKSLPKGRQKNERLQFLSEAAAEFRYFKDGWRNYVSHNKIAYDEAQAKRAYEHTVNFIETLSSRLKE